MKKFNWDLPADPDPKSDNYYNGIVSKELKAPSNVGEVLLGVIHRELVTNQSDFVNEGIQSILDRMGIKTDKPLTRKLTSFPGRGLHTWSPSRSRRRSTPTVLRELSLNSRFRRTENPPMCSAPNLSPCLVGGTTKPKFGNGRKGPGSIRLSRS